MNRPLLVYRRPLDVPPWRRVVNACLAFLAPVTTAIVISLALLWYAPAYLRRAELLEWERVCLAYAAPADQETYGGNAPECWLRFAAVVDPSFPQSAEVCFLHERRSPGGKSRLVVVAFDTVRHVFRVRAFDRGSRASKPRATFSDCVILNLGTPPPPPPEGVAYVTQYEEPHYAGQPDPADPAHFSFVWSVHGQTTVFDGWLRDGESVQLVARSNQYVLMIPKPPTPPAPASPATPP